jgi:hypothetical protein
LSGHTLELFARRPTRAGASRLQLLLGLMMAEIGKARLVETVPGENGPTYVLGSRNLEEGDLTCKTVKRLIDSQGKVCYIYL